MKMKLITGVCAALLVTVNAHAEVPNLFEKVRDLVSGAAAKQNAPAEPQNFGTDIVGSQPNQVPSQNTENGQAYFSKQQFLGNARLGNLADYGESPNYGAPITKQVVNIIGLILDKEYGTPIPNWDGKNKYAGGGSLATCDTTMVKEDIHTLMKAVTKNRISLLTKQPPEFTGTANPEDAQFINDMFRRIHSYCHRAGNQAEPFVKSLGQLMTEYAKATDEYVVRQRTAYIQQYQQATAQKAKEDKQRVEAVQQQEAARKAEEQAQIDADRRRIEEKERKAKEQDKNRVAG